MAGALSKRQQARNERVLQDLVQKVPGNKFCADCHAHNPAWASWSLGVFLCMRCASIHRKLGTHISKVKSLSMDSWSNEQVENMKKVGNLTSNKIYNPQGKKPPIPIDADEVDSAMERYIRQKYMAHGVNGARRHDTGSTESDEGTPPPLPPKTGKFNFRSASSIFPLGSRAKKEAAMRNILSSPTGAARSPSPRLTNKPSKVFGLSVEYDGGDDMAQKLARLRDMGSGDTQRNEAVLKGVNGSLERAIEGLVRPGEGDARSPLGLTSRDHSLRATRSLTPITPTSGVGPAPQSHHDGPLTPSTVSSTNPFDLQPPQPQSSQSTGTLQNKNPFFQTNPLGTPAQQNDWVSQAFQNMTLAPSQPLFPHHTGGIPAPQPNTQPLYQQSMTPPVPTGQSFVSVPFNRNLTYPQAVQQPTNTNPFMTQSLAVNTAVIPNQFGNNPFTRSPTRIQSPLGQIPEQAQQNVFGPQFQPQVANPAFAQQATQALVPQMTIAQSVQQPQRPDTASIMALYNYPQLAPRPLGQEHQEQAKVQDLTTQGAAQNTQAQRSESSPLPGSKNPFLSSPVSAPAPSAAGIGAPMGGRGYGSRDSMTLGMDMAWSNNGRHSPDAFASLSARV